jgi:hypothetical protein
MLATSYEIRSANAWRRERQSIKIQAIVRRFFAKRRYFFGCGFAVSVSVKFSQPEKSRRSTAGTSVA